MKILNSTAHKKLLVALLGMLILGQIGLILLRNDHFPASVVYFYGQIVGAALMIWLLENVGRLKNKIVDLAEKVSEKDEESKYIKPVCFDCGGTDFLEGPSAGVITNIKCAAKDCGSEYRYTGFGPMERLVRSAG